MSFLDISKILGLFFNTLNVDDKYSLRNRKNVLQPIQMQLSKKKNLSHNFSLNYYKIKSCTFRTKG